MAAIGRSTMVLLASSTAAPVRAPVAAAVDPDRPAVRYPMKATVMTICRVPIRAVA